MNVREKVRALLILALLFLLFLLFTQNDYRPQGTSTWVLCHFLSYTLRVILLLVSVSTVIKKNNRMFKLIVNAYVRRKHCFSHKCKLR